MFVTQEFGHQVEVAMLPRGKTFPPLLAELSLASLSSQGLK